MNTAEISNVIVVVCTTLAASIPNCKCVAHTVVTNYQFDVQHRYCGHIHARRNYDFMAAKTLFTVLLIYASVIGFTLIVQVNYTDQKLSRTVAAVMTM